VIYIEPDVYREGHVSPAGGAPAPGSAH
jgi:hypothetical protein